MDQTDIVTFVVGARVLEFRQVTLTFAESLKTDVFAAKNNKTVAQTLLHRKYLHLSEFFTTDHRENRDRKLGECVLELKRTGKAEYLKFLNRYGDDVYCDFRVDDPGTAKLKGLYCFVVDGQVRYLGRCTDSYTKRINQGYGRIHPKNCFRDGQTTNCHLNALIAKCREQVRVFVFPMADRADIESTERRGCPSNC